MNLILRMTDPKHFSEICEILSCERSLSVGIVGCLQGGRQKVVHPVAKLRACKYGRVTVSQLS